MPIGLSFSLRFPEPCLNTSVTLANLEIAGNFDEPIYCMKGARTQTFIGPYFPRKLREEKTGIWTLILTVTASPISKRVYSAK